MAIRNNSGKLVVISGFSGVGKGTVVQKLVEDYDHYALSVSMTTRQPRESEVNGVHYHFVTDEVFTDMIEKKGFLEFAGYVGNYYGTPKAFVEDKIRNGVDVILEIEVQGALQVKREYPKAVLIFITTPNAREMERRLTNRGTDSYDRITARMERALAEAEQMRAYDYVVVNDQLETCVRQLEKIINTEPEGPRYDPAFKARFVQQLREIITERKCSTEFD